MNGKKYRPRVHIKNYIMEALCTDNILELINDKNITDKTDLIYSHIHPYILDLSVKQEVKGTNIYIDVARKNYGNKDSIITNLIGTIEVVCHKDVLQFDDYDSEENGLRSDVLSDEITSIISEINNKQSNTINDINYSFLSELVIENESPFATRDYVGVIITFTAKETSFKESGGYA